MQSILLIEVFRGGRGFCMLRRTLALLALVFIVLCRFLPAWAEGYARTVYPVLSAALSAFSSLFPFSLAEVLVVGVIAWMLLLPFRERRRRKPWRHILLAEGEILVWIYIWFYMGWGLNYFRHNIYTRLQVAPAVYEEEKFTAFLHTYTDSLNATWLPDAGVTPETMEAEIKNFYRNVSPESGLASPCSWQRPKFFTFTPLYSGVGVLGSMGPFFAEAQLNRDLLPMQLPFTYAHEFSHLLGVSNEAEANYWAYRACTESASPALRYCGYFGLFPYVVSNASRLLSKEQFQAWLQTIRPEVLEEYKQNRNHWQALYSPLIGEVQDKLYNLFLKGNRIPSGQKNYAEVVGILLSLESYRHSSTNETSLF